MRSRADPTVPYAGPSRPGKPSPAPRFPPHVAGALLASSGPADECPIAARRDMLLPPTLAFEHGAVRGGSRRGQHLHPPRPPPNPPRLAAPPQAGAVPVLSGANPAVAAGC